MKTNNSVLNIIYQRKSVRHFNGKNVPKEIIEEILRAAMSAPSAVNCQPWEFIVVTDRSKLNSLGDKLPYAKMIYNAGAAIIVCAVPTKAHKKMPEYAIIDASLASENLLIAAEALGIGAIWTAAYPYEDRMETVRNILKIPKEVIPLNVIPIGYETGEDVPKEKFNPQNIHYDVW